MFWIWSTYKCSQNIELSENFIKFWKCYLILFDTTNIENLVNVIIMRGIIVSVLADRSSVRNIFTIVWILFLQSILQVVFLNRVLSIFPIKEHSNHFLNYYYFLIKKKYRKVFHLDIQILQCFIFHSDLLLIRYLNQIIINDLIIYFNFNDQPLFTLFCHSYFSVNFLVRFFQGYLTNSYPMKLYYKNWYSKNQ